MQCNSEAKIGHVIYSTLAIRNITYVENMLHIISYFTVYKVINHSYRYTYMYVTYNNVHVYIFHNILFSKLLII